jgi:hypothetical protein
MAAEATTAQTSRLLLLPAGMAFYAINQHNFHELIILLEIRNAIYDRIPVRSERIGLYPAHHRNYQKHRSPANATTWSDFRRQGLGLTQACRQTRHEFLPIFADKCTVLIELHYISQYVREFVLSRGKDIALATESIVLEVAIPECAVDMRDIILLNCVAPGLTIRTLWPLMYDTSGKNILEVKAGSAWHDYLSRCVSRLEWVLKADGECRCGWEEPVDDLDIVVYVTSEYAEDWMRNSEDGPEYRSALESWAQRLGIREMDCDRVCVDDGARDDAGAGRSAYGSGRRARRLDDECNPCTMMS